MEHGPLFLLLSGVCGAEEKLEKVVNLGDDTEFKNIFPSSRVDDTLKNSVTWRL